MVELRPTAGGTPLEFIVDTGYSEELLASCDTLRLFGWRLVPRGPGQPAVLADGSVVPTYVYRSSITWFGRQRDVWVEDFGPRAPSLVGFTLLAGTRIALGADSVEIEQAEESAERGPR
ncbi:MAG: hypothetical protein QME96_16630 [Myxococcota bacterium]|nr:hypothetical protein [Myxococcota bacterium]